MKFHNKIFLVYFLSLLGIILWIVLIFLAPYLKSVSSPWHIFLYTLFAPICHQAPERSFFLCGYPLAVCARCLGIYSGFLAGTGVYPFLKGFSSLTMPKTINFLLLSLPIGIDTLGNFFHIWNTTNTARFFIGFLWGTILPFYFIYGLSDLWLNLPGKKD
ncbi:MAG: DUF2085 domain-containing protein [Candidatus Aminicenantes bacterium]